MFNRLFARGKPGVRQVLLHNHFFKNAGTTIDWSLERCFGAAFCDHRDDQDMNKGGMAYLGEYLTRRPRLVAVSSHHMPFDLAFEAPDFTFWHILMLREPIARALSVYRYEYKQPGADSLGAKMAKQLDMKQYFEWRLGNESPAVLRDFHTRALASLRRKHRPVLREPDYVSAVTQARHPRVLIGFVERFDESMVMFEHMLKEHFQGIDLSHVVQNKSRESSTDPRAALQSDLGDELYSLLQQRNAFDLRLYGELLGEFETRIGAMAGFEQELSDYKGRCARM